MHPMQMQEGDRGVGMGYTAFINRFETICQEHLHEGRARAFAFVFYDMTNGVVRRALSDAQGFRLLHEKTGKDITLFYLHDRAIEAHWRSFNKTFMEALGVEDQAVPSIRKDSRHLLAMTWRPSLCDCGFAKLGAGMLAFAV
ncbi:MAG: hypothetical protein R3E99_17135 [Burkholderiaceae bacterium]